MPREDFRLSYHEVQEVLARRLAEPPPGRIQLLAGPRQVGKTTLVLDLAKRHGPAAIYAAMDGPEAALPGFWERLWLRADEAASRDGRALVVLDEIHLLPNWSWRLKGEFDHIRRRRRPIHVVATGSSALRLDTGSKESLAGRFERLTLTHWSASSLVEAFGVTPEEAPNLLVRMGSYPGAYEYQKDIPRWTAYVRDAILEPAIGRDILSLAPVRKPALVRQVFGVAASSPAQIVALQKIQGQLQDAGALETIAHYLSLLQEAYLVAPLGKYSAKPARHRASPPKLVVLSNALLAAADPRGVPDRDGDPARFGAWVENACLAHAWNREQRVSYWREEPHEVDGVLEGSWGPWAIEVKTGPITTADLKGLAQFVHRHPKFRPLVLGDDQARLVAERAGFDAMAWTDFLLRGPPSQA
jgi:predicted AAA+ superfamily ATPase